MNVAKNLSMKLEELKSHLQSNQELNLILPNGQFVPKHFHITEVGMNTRHFIDCGGTERIEKKVNLQLWVEDRDPDHRLSPEKLLSIINEPDTSALGLLPFQRLYPNPACIVIFSKIKKL